MSKKKKKSILKFNYNHLYFPIWGFIYFIYYGYLIYIGEGDWDGENTSPLTGTVLALHVVLFAIAIYLIFG